jgi:hypothetical protein
MTTIDDLLRTLSEVAPALGELRDQHVQEYGELLPHVLFGDVTRWLLANHPQSEVLQALEAASTSGDADTRELIAASFVENIKPGAEYADLRGALGPRLREMWNAMYT